MAHPELNQADSERLCSLGKAVIETEQQAISALLSRVDSNFAQACHYLLHCQGRIVVLGMGKSGHIGSKIAATLASTGSPAFFVHPGEASHGDLGMITDKDVVIALSNSGTTQELMTIVPIIKRLGVPLISLTGNPKSPLAENADVHLDVSVAQEACPLDLAPTSSTTATLVMGDALAIALLDARGFTAEDFARTHPAGALGQRLLLRVDNLMHSGDQVPSVQDDSTIAAAIVEVTKKRLGMTCVYNSDGDLVGIFTDGDLRRCLDKQVDIKTTPIRDVMTASFKSIAPQALAAEAMGLLQKHKITALVVSADNKKCLGIIHLHALLNAGVL